MEKFMVCQFFKDYRKFEKFKLLEIPAN